MILALIASCGGWDLHDVSKPAGESLQGWYPSKTKAHEARRVLAKTELHPAMIWLARVLASVQVAVR